MTLGVSLGGCDSIPDPQPLPKGVTFSGTWDTNWGQMSLDQRGGSVEGSFRVHGRYKGFRNGSITGTATGNVLLFRWTQVENRQYGRGYLQMSPDRQRLEGRWGYQQDAEGGGRWWATRVVQ